MPPLTKRRSVKRSPAPLETKSPEGTQKTENPPLEIHSLMLRLSQSELRCVTEIQGIESTLVSETDLKRFFDPIRELSDSEERTSLQLFVSPESSLPAVSQDSVCRLLMRVQPIQPLLVSFLLSKLTEHSDEEIAPNYSSSSSSSSSSSNSLLNALLNQLRWTDFLADASALVSGLLETLAICSPSLQRELILLLPDLTHDDLQETCVRELFSFLRSDASLCAPILTALENLRLTAKQFAENLPIIAGTLSTVSLADLPVLIRFLLRTSPITAGTKNSEEIDSVFRTIRSTCHPAHWTGFPAHFPSLADDPHVGSAVFEELRSCFQQRPDLARAFLRFLQKTAVEELVPLDVWVLLVLWRENLQTYQAERFLSRGFARLPGKSAIFAQAIAGQRLALLPAFKSLLQ
ncbi:uncharacterized protein [Blastocystis hominis]|uniref:Uncharacterized protein n=1 Tax=Blastocystis hominis TaxID=12968 RepID=D8MAW5_BLAHO|nr:uncharacterized protein [Blastocystis hominis]CBK25204.2 unnamed protein product [Blastocystis hominis]|eukprot:XP_012899252.1 uncharacterized protein [Blastocystis hominis]